MLPNKKCVFLQVWYYYYYYWGGPLTGLAIAIRALSTTLTILWLLPSSQIKPGLVHFCTFVCAFVFFGVSFVLLYFWTFPTTLLCLLPSSEMKPVLFYFCIFILLYLWTFNHSTFVFLASQDAQEVMMVSQSGKTLGTISAVQMDFCHEGGLKTLSKWFGAVI